MKLAVILLVVVALVAIPINAWNEGDGGLVRWDNGCYWIDDGSNQLATKPSLAEQCGGVCIATTGCRKFSWHDGTCFLHPYGDLGTGQGKKLQGI